MALKVLGVVVLLLALGAGLVFWGFVFGQDLRVVDTPGGSLIDVQWIGEYQANVRRIRISDARTGNVLWELTAANGGSFPLWNVLVQEGSNQVLPERVDGAEVVVPNGLAFQLSIAVTYRVDLWTYKYWNDWSVPRHVSKTFALPSRQGA